MKPVKFGAIRVRARCPMVEQRAYISAGINPEVGFTVYQFESARSIRLRPYNALAFSAAMAVSGILGGSEA